MEGFKVYYSKMNTAGGDMEDYARKLQQYREDVLIVRNRLRGKISSADQIGGRLNHIASMMEASGSTMAQMGKAAAVISRTYHRTENSLTASEDGVLNILDKASEFIEWLEDKQEKWDKTSSLWHLVDYFKAGRLSIVEKDGYYIIKGLKNLRVKDQNLRNIKGTRYKIGSQKFNESGLKWLSPANSSPKIKFSKFLSNIKDKALWKDTFKDFAGETYKFRKGELVGNLGKALSYTGIVLKTGTNVYENYKSGASGSKIMADVTTDVAKGLADMAVATGCAKIDAAIGTAIPIPVVGTVVGAAAGFVLGRVGEKVFDTVVDDVKIGGKSISGWVSTGLESAYDGIGNSIQDRINDTQKAINGFISSFGKLSFG